MRNNFTTRPLLYALVALAAFSSIIIAHRAIASGNVVPNRTFTITDNVNMVLLFARVRNQGGTYVSGLKKSDFQVFDDGNGGDYRVQRCRCAGFGGPGRG